jgi:hypothetical protein
MMHTKSGAQGSSGMLTAADYSQLAQQADMQRAQAVLAGRHSPKTEELLLGRAAVARELAEWQPSVDAAELYKSLGLAASAPHRTARIALDGVISDAHCEVLKAAADAAMPDKQAHKCHANVAVGAVGAVAAAQRRAGTVGMLSCRGEVLSRLAIYKTRLQIMEYYAEDELYESGSVVTRISCVSSDTVHDGAQVNYACLHVDKANIGSYDYSALLYLSDYGTDFQGGKFAFCEDEVARLVEPKRGRLVAFTSGPENLHQVRPVTQGTRYVLAMWFTKERQLGLEVSAAASAPPTIQVSTLGRQKEIQNVLTSMRRDIDEVLLGIRKVRFCKR